MNEFSLPDLITASSAQDVLVQSLKDYGFEGDLTKSSPIYQLLIDPAAVIYSVQVGQQELVKNAWKVIQDSDGSLPYDTEVVKNLFGNIRLNPAEGSLASGEIQLVFSNNSARSLVGTSFIAPNGSTFLPTLPYSLVPSESYRRSFSESELVYEEVSGGYGVNVKVTASSVGEAHIASGDLFTTALAGLVSSKASVSFASGRNIESSQELLNSIPAMLSETSMASPISLVSEIYKEFPEIKDVITFRAGDPEMVRANKNALGLDSGCGDITVVTSSRPNMKRLFISGHLELSCVDGDIYNSNHRLGAAYRVPSSDEAHDMVDAGTLLDSNVYIEGDITKAEDATASYILDAGIATDSTQATPELTPDSPVRAGVALVSRSLSTDDRYGSLPVAGNDTKDFYESSYQSRVRYEFLTDWESIEELDEGVANKVKVWMLFWRVFNQAIATDIDMTANLVALAEDFGVGNPDDVPNVYRVEVPTFVDYVGYQSLAKIQEYINSPDRRCFGQDYLVKSPKINSVTLSITVSRDAGFIRFKEDHFKNKVADFINSKTLRHSGSVTTEHIKELLFSEGPSDVNDYFNLAATTRVNTSSGEWVTSTGNSVEYLLVDEGVTDNNSVLSCSPRWVEFTYI